MAVVAAIAQIVSAAMEEIMEATPNNLQNTRGNHRPKIKCQVCFKDGHLATNCWHRFDLDYVPNDRNASAATNTYGADSNWFTNTSATDHITRELNKLVVHDAYHGNGQIKTTNGADITINHVGQAIVHTPTRDLHLNDILHVLDACKNLVSIHRLASDNHAFLEFHPNFFLVKDQGRKKFLLKGTCKGGLYPLPSVSHQSSR
jgi:hypothetical protein